MDEGRGETITIAWMAQLQFVPLVPQKDHAQLHNHRGRGVNLNQHKGYVCKTSRKIHLLAWLVFDAFQAEILNGQGLLLSTIVHSDIAWHEDLKQYKMNHGYPWEPNTVCKLDIIITSY